MRTLAFIALLTLTTIVVTAREKDAPIENVACIDVSLYETAALTHGVELVSTDMSLAGYCSIDHTHCAEVQDQCHNADCSWDHTYTLGDGFFIEVIDALNHLSESATYQRTTAQEHWSANCECTNSLDECLWARLRLRQDDQQAYNASKQATSTVTSSNSARRATTITRPEHPRPTHTSIRC